jgi:transcription elongation factor Elf1
MHSQIHVSAEFVQPPQCPHCGGQMRFVPIVNERSDHGMRTFECPLCQHDEAVVLRLG